MGAWVKLFDDGTEEYGSDEKIAQRKASWTNGRHNGIKTVKLFNLQQIATLSVPNTSWHQFDRFIVTVAVGTQQPQVTHRVVQAEIKPHHIGQSLVCSRTGERFFWAVVQDMKDAEPNSFFYKQIAKNHIGKWLTVILPERDYPAVTFSTRGKMNDYQCISR